MNAEAGVCGWKISKSFQIQANSPWICSQKCQKWIFLASPNLSNAAKTIFRHLRCPFGQEPGAGCAPLNFTEAAQLKYKVPQCVLHLLRFASLLGVEGIRLTPPRSTKQRQKAIASLKVTGHCSSFSSEGTKEANKHIFPVRSSSLPLFVVDKSDLKHDLCLLLSLRVSIP